nr:uncharacterized protein LOC125422525 isoform X1 [Ziziphus jujuba var. spinosa]
MLIIYSIYAESPQAYLEFEVVKFNHFGMCAVECTLTYGNIYQIFCRFCGGDGTQTMVTVRKVIFSVVDSIYKWCVISDYLSTSSSTTTMYQRHSLQEEMEKELLIDFLVNFQMFYVYLLFFPSFSASFVGDMKLQTMVAGRMVSHNLWTMFSVVDGRLYLALWDGDMVQKVVG